MTTSAFAEHAWKFIERGISVVPIAPGTKRPGQYEQATGWRGMSDWTRFAKRLPTEIEIEAWSKWPDAGIGVVLGEVSNLIALDKDYDLPGNGNDALQAIIPYSPVAKKGEKGWTRFFRYNGEKSCSFDVNGARVLDVLAEGRQTVVPPTAHPSGCSYVWITEDALDTILSVNELPQLPSDFLEKVAQLLAGYQTEADKKHQRPQVKRKDTEGPIDTSLSMHAEYFKDLNRCALDNLHEWVPKLVPTAKPHADGYRAIATWRGVKNPNVGIHPAGIKDWGGNYGMTALDLVMYANGLTFQRAAEVLRQCLPMGGEESHITMTVGGVAQNQAAAPNVVAPIIPPWLRPAVQPQTAVAPPTVMLPPTTSFEPAPAVPAFVANPPGILADIAAWITATAPKQQAELSTAAAIALASVIMGRTYRSQYGNFTSLYLVMIGKSTEGKEHPQGCVDKILNAAELPRLIGGSGYTSAGAVYSALLKSPAHITTIDEMGKLLKVSRAKGNAHAEAAIDKLVEAFGRQDGIMRPPTYSSMTLKDPSAASATDRVVHNPAITLLGATTPGTFYGNLTNDLVQDGFLGRCIVVESKQPRQLIRLSERSNTPPQKIIDWCRSVHITGAQEGNLVGVCPAEMPAHTIELRFDDACQPLLREFEAELNTEKDASEADGLDVLLGRTLEKAMKLAMIACKAESPANRTVKPAHLAWGIDYVRHYDTALVRAVRENRFESQTDEEIKRAMKFIAQAPRYASDARFGAICATGALPHSKLLKLMVMPGKQFRELMDTAVEAGVVLKGPGGEWGYTGDVYRLP